MEHAKPLNLKKVCLFLMGGYLVFVLVFYFAAHDQLFIRSSKRNIENTAGDLAAGELLSGQTVTQTFLSEMDLIHMLSVRLATFNRRNEQTIQVRLLDQQTGEPLFSGSLEAAALADSQPAELAISPPLEGMYGRWLLLELRAADGTSGNAVAPWYRSQGQQEGWSLQIAGQPVVGTLCFGVSGQDYVWTGPHYGQLAAVGGAAVALYCLYILYRSRHGRTSLVVNALYALSNYRFLIEQLVTRDFKTKYKRSVLGVFWSFLNPLLTMTVQYIVFSTIFKSDIENYPVYLLSGVVLFNFFSEATGMSIMSVVGNASLITKVYVPKYIYPVTRVCSSSVNLLISLLPLLLMILFTHTPITRAYLLLVFPLGCLLLFCIGLAFLLSASMVFFRDTQFIWSVFSLLWMYMTPIFYPENILPPQFAAVHRYNPLYYFVKVTRTIIIDGISPEPRVYLICAIFTLAMLGIGGLVFHKTQDKFVFYI
ncbi:MAG: ABC transporter permease [Anaerotruncus sp.]|nr:ABC transporter permease [Anaerotruncus sp.]